MKTDRYVLIAEHKCEKPLVMEQYLSAGSREEVEERMIDVSKNPLIIRVAIAKLEYVSGNNELLSKYKEQENDDKFTVGSQWESREGGRCVVVNANEHGFLLVWHEKLDATLFHAPDGEVNVKSERFDLIRPWREPESGKCYLYIGKSFDGTIISAQFNENIDYKFPYGYKSLARVAVDWKEGQFDD